LMLADFSYRV